MSSEFGLISDFKEFIHDIILYHVVNKTDAMNQSNNTVC